MNKYAVELLRLVPKNAASRCVGAMLRGPWPAPVHQMTIKAFVRAFGVDVDEAERAVVEYPTFAEFFCRRLKPGARPIDDSRDALVSPSDGTVGAFGPVTEGRLLQAKGRPYSLGALLGDQEVARRFEGGHYLTIYLSPSNYHRVHFPVSGGVVEMRHLPGTLWPVNPPAVERVQDLFAVNERLVTHVESAHGPVAIVMVGATCVGRIRALYDDAVTNDGVDIGGRAYSPPLAVEKGDELGAFEMGSTVVLLLGPGWSLDSDALSGKGATPEGDAPQALRMGRKIAAAEAI